MAELEVLFAAVSVRDFGVATSWYGRFFGRPPDIDVKDDEAMWRIGDGAWVYVVVDHGRAGHALITLSVADLERAAADIAGRGIAVGAVEAVGTAGRKMSIADPDGNMVSLIEVA